MRNKKKFISVFVILLFSFFYLITSSFNKSSVYYLEVDELIAAPEQYQSKGIRMSGNMDKNSLIQKTSEKYLEFSLLGKAGAGLKVIYNGMIPDAFSSDAPVIVEGNYNISDKIFYAKNLMAKCPSKYEVSVEK